MASAQRRQQRRDRWYKRRSRYREERKYRYQNCDRSSRQTGGAEPTQPELDAALLDEPQAES